MMKTVEKPWGKEEWIILTDHYCMKTLHVNKGHRLSLQYHENKTETSIVMRGRVEVTLGEDTKEYGPGASWHCEAGTHHRMKAIVDSMIVECSTIEVDDVVRLEDDYDREKVDE
jgi:quercetin dioxygenase-like cupin family protein